jgi:hypothetical protein
MGLPLADAQFWAVTGIVVLAVWAAVRRIARALRSESKSPCAGCPKAPERVATPRSGE